MSVLLSWYICFILSLFWLTTVDYHCMWVSLIALRYCTQLDAYLYSRIAV